MKKTVLVIDDNPQFNIGPSDIVALSRGGIELARVENPKQAASFVAMHSVAFVIAKNPEFCHQLQKNLESIPNREVKIFVTRTLIDILRDKPDALGAVLDLSEKEVNLLRTILLVPDREVDSIKISGTGEVYAVARSKTPGQKLGSDTTKKVSVPKTPLEVSMKKEIKIFVNGCLDFLAFRTPFEAQSSHVEIKRKPLPISPAVAGEDRRKPTSFTQIIDYLAMEFK